MSELFNRTPECPGDYGVVCKIFFATSGTTTANELSILHERNQFYPWPLRQSGNQGTFGSCNRCISESCDPSSTSGSVERSVHLQNQNSHSAALSSRHSPVLTHEPRARQLPLAIVLPCSFFTNRRIVLPTSKEVLITIIRTPVLGHVGSREAVSQTRKARVAFDQALSGRQGVVAHDRFAQANLSAQAVR